MRKFERPTLTALVIGLAIGLIAGVATETFAGFGKKGWERFGAMFQQGYVAGFIDAVRLAKSRSGTQSYLARNYPVPAAAKAIHWAHEVEQIYAEERFQKLYVADVLQIAAQRLSSRMGAEASYEDPGLASMRRMVERRHKALIERMKQLKSEGKLVEGRPMQSAKPVLKPKQLLKNAREEFARNLGSKAPAWQNMLAPIRRGFVSGFNECVGIAKFADPDGFVAKTYPLTSKSDKKEKHWTRAMMEIYGKDDEARVLEPASIAMAWAGKSLIERGAPALTLSQEQASVLREKWQRALTTGPTPYVEK